MADVDTFAQVQPLPLLAAEIGFEERVESGGTGIHYPVRCIMRGNT